MEKTLGIRPFSIYLLFFPTLHHLQTEVILWSNSTKNLGWWFSCDIKWQIIQLSHCIGARVWSFLIFKTSVLLICVTFFMLGFQQECFQNLHLWGFSCVNLLNCEVKLLDFYIMPTSNFAAVILQLVTVGNNQWR